MIAKARVRPGSLPRPPAPVRPSTRYPWLLVLAALIGNGCGASDPGTDTQPQPDMTESDAETAFDLLMGTETEPTVPEPDETLADPRSGTESGNPTLPAPTGVNEPEPPTPSAGPSDVGEPPMTGNPGMPPAPLCSADTCAALATQRVQQFAQALPAPEAHTEAMCGPAGDCHCVTQSGEVVLHSGNEAACLVPGRFGCLYSSSDYDACNPAGADTCPASCEAVYRARVADATGVVANVLDSRCTSSGCQFVLISDGGQCLHGGEALADTPIDCAMAADILGQ